MINIVYRVHYICNKKCSYRDFHTMREIIDFIVDLEFENAENQIKITHIAKVTEEYITIE